MAAWGWPRTGSGYGPADPGGRSGHDRGMARSASTDGRAVRALRGDPGNPADPDSWPATVPAVAQILAGSLQLAAGLTVLIGENGSGKSTVVENARRGLWAQPAGRLGPGVLPDRQLARDRLPFHRRALAGATALVLLPARGHDARALYLPGRKPRPEPGAFPRAQPWGGL